MKASELRIGNYIKQPNGVNMVFRISEGEDVNTFPEEEIDPIPLTEEWLLNFGFVYDSRYEEYIFDIKDNRYIKLIDYESFFSSYLWDSGNECTISAEIKYAHQLQNIYFALTGEELTLKSE